MHVAKPLRSCPSKVAGKSLRVDLAKDLSCGGDQSFLHVGCCRWCADMAEMVPEKCTLSMRTKGIRQRNESCTGSGTHRVLFISLPRLCTHLGHSEPME